MDFNDGFIVAYFDEERRAFGHFWGNSDDSYGAYLAGGPL